MSVEMPRLSSSCRKLRASDSVTSFSTRLLLRASPRSSPPWLASTIAKYFRATEEALPAEATLGGEAAEGEAAGNDAGDTVFWEMFVAAAIVIVRPSLLKLAMTGAVELTVITAAPPPSLYVAEGIVLLPNVNIGNAGETRGSRLNVMRKIPGSVDTVGLTGDVKLNTRRDGFSPVNDAVK